MAKRTVQVGCIVEQVLPNKKKDKCWVVKNGTLCRVLETKRNYCILETETGFTVKSPYRSLKVVAGPADNIDIGSAMDGALRLAAAVLMQAIKDLHDDQYRPIVLAWFNAKDSDYAFSFNRICEYFNLDRDSCLERILQGHVNIDYWNHANRVEGE